MAWTLRELANLDLSTLDFGDERPSRDELEDQYYAALGELIEQRPIGRPPGDDRLATLAGIRIWRDVRAFQPLRKASLPFMSSNDDNSSNNSSSNASDRTSALHAIMRDYKVEEDRLLALCAHLDEDDYAGRVDIFNRLLDPLASMMTAKMARDCQALPRETPPLVTISSMRSRLFRQYSFGVPNALALSALGEENAIVEMGAGTGFWAYLLRKHGTDVIAYDEKPVIPGSSYNAYGFERSWTEVLPGSVDKLIDHRNRTLLLCWPDYNTPFASEALRHFPGSRLAYVGEGYGGCTGDNAFHEALARDWEQCGEVVIPQWHFIHDNLTFYRRRGR